MPDQSAQHMISISVTKLHPVSDVTLVELFSLVYCKIGKKSNLNVLSIEKLLVETDADFSFFKQMNITLCHQTPI